MNCQSFRLKYTFCLSITAMSSPAETELSFYLLKHYFGPIVADVFKAVDKYDLASIRLIKTLLPDHSQADLKKALLILVKHQFVDYSRSNRGFEYLVAHKRTRYFFRTSKYIQYVNNKFGKLAATIVLKLAQKALLSKKQLVDIVIEANPILKKDDQCKKDTIEPVIDQLINLKFIRLTCEHYCLNYERFNTAVRDQFVANTVFKLYNGDRFALQVCEAILDIASETTADDSAYSSPVAFNDLCTRLDVDQEKFQKNINTLLAKEFIVQSGHHPTRGSLYTVNIRAVIDRLVKENISSVVKNKFGPKCCRVFRMLLMRGPLLLKQLEDSVMLPNRDVKEYVYMLIKEGFIRNRQVPKTPDNAPSKSVFILSVDLNQIVFNTLDLSCKTITNLLIRHEFEKEKHKALLDRAKVVREIILSSTCAEEWSQYFNNHELSDLSKIDKTIRKMTFARMQVDDTLSLLEQWIALRLES